MAKINEDIIKRAVISGAARALKYKDQNPQESSEQILRKVMAEVREIAREIDRN